MRRALPSVPGRPPGQRAEVPDSKEPPTSRQVSSCGGDMPMMTRDVLLEMELEEDDEEDGDIGERGVSTG